MEKVIALKPNRSYYTIVEAMDDSMTVGDFIEELEQYSREAKVVFSNDRGYTYGFINGSSIADLTHVYEEETAEEE